jgi:outer membrane protein OmpA-like peptidoglycan-associated protein
MEFNAAIKKLSENIFAQVRQNQNVIGRMGNTVFVVDPFIDANTAEVTEMSRQIEQLMTQQLRASFPNYRLEPMNAKTVQAANFVINGTTRIDRSSAESFYRVSSSVVDIKTGVVIANAEVWLENKQLKHNPVSSYRDSPMYLKDKRVGGYIATSLTPAGELADREYFESLPTSALLTEADRVFDEGDFKRALSIYQIAESRPDGRIMKTYSALYQCYRKTGQMSEAENAFVKLVDVGLANTNISTRFLFTVNSTEFVNDADLRSQYALWLRHIARRTSAAGVCLQVLGHSSRTGSERYNEGLSLQRAQAVQKAMQKDFPAALQKTKAIGRGYRDNVIGSGTDDSQDAIDRRVEFRVVDCDLL